LHTHTHTHTQDSLSHTHTHTHTHTGLFMSGTSTMVGTSDYKKYAATGVETEKMQGLRDLVGEGKGGV
jgi:hypothetical protein